MMNIGLILHMLLKMEINSCSYQATNCSTSYDEV